VGNTATVIAIAYLVAVVLGIGVVVGLLRTTRGTREQVDTEKLAHREKTWLGIVIVLLVALLFGTIFFIPYGTTASKDAQIVNVDSVQFGWTVEPATVTAGAPVLFRLTSQDVNHGFGVYDENDELLFQVQVVPGKIQEADYTFEQPGTYSILCLEFCGVGHHVMRGQLTVEPA
jgi:cytochrome c oxidase subunit 2